MRAATYLDSSAIVKLVVEEAESTALRRHLRRGSPLVSSTVARTEVHRALLLENETAVARAREVLARIDLVRLSDRVLSAAGALMPPELRSLDAIHLASAQALGEDLGEVITYDKRMVAAARRIGLNSSSPG